MSHTCPSCGEQNVRLWVVEDLSEPFGCIGCIRKRGLEAVEAPLAARDAWPEMRKEELARRIDLAVSLADGVRDPAGALTRAAAGVALVEAVGRLLGRRRREGLAAP